MSKLPIEAWRIRRNRRNRINRSKRGPRLIAIKYFTVAALQLPTVTWRKLATELWANLRHRN